MKNIVLLFVMFIMFFSSCQKNEEFVDLIDFSSIRSQLAKIPLPTEEEFKIKLTEQNTLKSAVVSSGIAKIFTLLDYTYQISNDKAVKNSLCLEVDNSGYFSRVFTLYQTFAIINGKIDDTRYDLRVEPGCPFSKVIKVKDELNTNYIWYWAHLFMENGEELGYFDPNVVFSESHLLEIYPIKGVSWEIQVGANVQYGLGKNQYEILSVPVIKEDLFVKNKDSKSHIEVSVNFNLAKESNLYLEIPKTHCLWNASPSFWIESIFLFGDGKNLRLEVGSNEIGNSSKRIFPVPFALGGEIQVAYRSENSYSSQSYIRRFRVDIGRIVDGKTYYNVGDELKN